MVLEAKVRKATIGDTDALHFQALPLNIAVLRDDTTEHVLIADGLRHVRMQLRGASILDGPVRLSFTVPSLRHALPQILVLRRLSALWRLRRLPRPLFPVDPVVVRRVQALQILDARRAGAGQRATVIAVLGPKMADAVSFDSSRKKIGRLLKLAQQRVEIGYRRFMSEHDWSWEG
jgi:hypothetical protein